MGMILHTHIYTQKWKEIIKKDKNKIFNTRVTSNGCIIKTGSRAIVAARRWDVAAANALTRNSRSSTKVSFRRI